MPTRYYPVRTERGGRAYNASYDVQAGRLSVSSAYGSKSAELGEQDPKTLARRLLDEIIASRQ